MVPLILIVLCSGFFLRTPLTCYSLSNDSEVADKLTNEAKFENLLWQKIQSLKSNGTIERLPLIIRLRDQGLDSKQVEDLKRSFVSLLENRHGATVYSILNVIPVIMATVPFGEAEKISSYTFVDSIGDGERKGHFCLDISRPAIRADQVTTQLGFDGKEITIAIIDTGVDATCPDLDDLDDDPATVDPKIIDDVCFVDRDHDGVPDESPDDFFGHGTMVAGVASGTGEASNHRYTGIAPGAWIMNCKIGYLVDNDAAFDEDDAVNAINYAVSQGANVINLSGQLTGDTNESSQLTMAVDDAVEHGAVVVVAAGNKPQGPMSTPANAFNAIVVGAVDDKGTISITDDQLWDQSCEGPMGQGRPKPDVVAPGANITAPAAVGSVIWRGVPDHRVGSNYMWFAGTSLAAPHVSGTAALMLQANPNLTPAQVKAILRQTARLNSHLDPLSVNQRGHGIVDALAAVQLALNTNSIDKLQMYDSWAASTPTHDLPYYCYDYLTFTVSPPSSKGISMENIDYHLKWFGVPITEYRLLKQEYVRDIWIDGTYHNLGDEMGTHLLSGPRVYEKGPGYLKLRAKYLIGSVSVVCYWDMTQNGQDFWIEYAGGSSWKTLIVINPEIWGPSNYAFLGNYGPTVLLESRIADLPYFYIRRLGSDVEYLKVFPEYSIYTAWLLKHGYTGTNPNEDLALNSEYIYNRDLDLYIQMDCQSPAVAVLRVTDSPLPAPANHQNDAGSGGDAGNSFGYATYVNPGSYTGILCNSDPSDTQDWYQFYVDSGLTVIVYVIPPRGIDFDLELYDQSYQLKSSSHNGPGIPEAVGIDNCQAGWWRARIYTISGEAQYSFSVSIKEASTPRCPYVFTWDGQRYVIDNNLLPTSLKNNGTDVEDYYKLEQPLVPTYQSRSFSLYKLQISEFENEHSYIDQVRLLAVDHSGDCNIAVTPEGEIVTYGQPQPPISCVDNNGTNRLSQTQLIDGNVSDPSTYFDGYKGDYLVVNFGQVTSQNAKLILRSDRKCYYPGAEPPCCIQVQILNNSQWQTVSVLAPREYWATEAVNLSPYVAVGQDLTVRLYWTMPHRLDYVGLDATPQETFEIHYAQIVSATHNVEGSVLWKLQNNDEVYAELVPGQQIRLTFLMPNAQNQNEERTFIFYTEGHYNIIA